MVFKNWETFRQQNEYSRIMDQVQKGERVFVWPKDIARGKGLFPFPLWDKR